MESKQPLLPAQDTKHIPLLCYQFRDQSFELIQSNDGGSSGTTLWLGGQILTAYLADTLPAVQHLSLVGNAFLPISSESHTLTYACLFMLSVLVLFTDLPSSNINIPNRTLNPSIQCRIAVTPLNITKPKLKVPADHA